MKKKLIIGVVIIAVIILGVIFVGPRWGNWWQRYQANKILREYATLDEAYRNDSYGSSTPEGTLALFVDALKQGDAELASKYFVVEKRELGFSQIKTIIKNNRTKEVVRELQNYKDKHLSDDMKDCIFSTYYQEEKVWSETNLRLNKYSQKWLIESL